MKHEQPNYYSIIPATVRYDEKLKANEKLLYGEITALANKNGYCWATNLYFSRLYNVTRETVSRWISNLEQKGYIRTEVIRNKDTQVIEKRTIYLQPMPIDEKINTPKQKDQYPIDEKINTLLTKKSKSNNTSINNTSINKDHSTTKVEQIPYKKIIDYLNEQTGRKYSHKANKNQDLIKARWNEGFRLDDFIKVIDNKVNDWLKDGKMNQYLRPATLFSNKFDGYLNEVPVNNVEQKSANHNYTVDLDELLGGD